MHPASDAESMKQEFQSIDTCPYRWTELDVQLPIDQIEEILERTGVLQLRPIPENCRIAVVGCGNKPLADSGGYPLFSDVVQDEESEKYQREHKHPGAVTINPDLAFNPTLVAFFGEQKIPMLKSGELDLIVIEGTHIIDSPIGREELQRLPSLNGRVVWSIDHKRGLEFSWENNSKNTRAPDYQEPPVVIEDLNIYPSFNFEE